MKNILGVIFDCDGVIINSAADLASGVNVTLDHFNLNRLNEDLLVSYVGHGARNLIERSVKTALENDGKDVSFATPEKIDEILKWYKEYYKEHAVERTVLYPGFADFLEYLMLNNIRMTVVSNKPQSITDKILSYFDIDEYFDAVIGPEQLTQIKPNPEGLQKAFDRMKSASGNKADFLLENVLMVGDSDVDIQAGHNFGCKTCAVKGGLGDTEKLLAEKADFEVQFAGELRKILEQN